MTRDEWIAKMITILDARGHVHGYISKTDYEKAEKERGWRTKNVECISLETWLDELAFDDRAGRPRVYRPYKDSKIVTMWCKENCDGHWCVTLFTSSWWEFELETDAMAFKLRWGN